MYGNIKQCLPCISRVTIIDLIKPHGPKNDHIIIKFDNVLIMSQTKTKVAVSCLHKNRLYQNTVSRNLCISKKMGRNMQLSFCILSLHGYLFICPYFFSLYLSLIWLTFTETLLYLPFKLNISKDCL